MTELVIRIATVMYWLAIGTAIEELALAEKTAAWRSKRFNAVYTVAYVAFDVVVASLAVTALAGWVMRIPGAGLVRLPVTNTSSTVALWSAAVVWSVLQDGLYYWMHRLQHATPFLWAEHELHHSDPCMNVTTNQRHHWLELPLQAMFVTLPFLYLVAAPEAVVFRASMLLFLMGHFIHLNSRISLGPLGRLIANPRHHRIHHSAAREHFDKNFAAVCPLWDIMFGTYHAPRSGEFPRTGVDGTIEHPSLWEAIVWPFRRWRTMWASRTAQSTSQGESRLHSQGLIE